MIIFLKVQNNKVLRLCVRRVGALLAYTTPCFDSEVTLTRLVRVQLKKNLMTPTKSMKKLLSIAAIASLFVASQASAVSYYSDVDFINEKVTTSNSYDGEFNIVDNGGDSLLDILAIVGAVAGDGYDAATETVVDAWAFFTLTDDYDLSSEQYKVDLGTELFKSGSSVSWLFTLATGSVGVNGIIDLDADGKLSYSVSATSGDFKLINAGILAKADARSVADSGTTLALLGLGFLGLVGYRRRFAK